MILAEGGGGLSVAFDMPTLMGRDSDDPRSLGEVGHCGVAIDSAADMDVLFDGIDLAATTTSMTISGPAVPVFCMYVVAAERQGADISKLNGTLQTDIFKEYIAQKEWIYPPEPHLKLIGDLMEYVAHDIPAYKPLSVSGYHIREAGATAAQELAFTLADGFGYVELGLVARPGHRAVRAGPVVLLRRAHRLLRGDRQVPGGAADLGALDARRLRREDRPGAVAAVPHPDGRRLAHRAAARQQHRPHGRRGDGRRARRHELAAHQRPGRGAGAAVSAKAAQIALRTQQVIAEETGVLNVADPLGGSWYVEALTDRIEAEAEAIFERIRDLGRDGSITAGLLRGIEDGWFIGEIADSAFAYQVALEKGDKRVVGVNTLTGDVGDELEILRVSHEVELEQRAPVAERRASRDQAAVDAALARMVEAANERPEHRAADARRRPGRGDPRRDLRCVQADLGRVPRARPVLNRFSGHPIAAAAG